MAELPVQDTSTQLYAESNNLARVRSELLDLQSEQDPTSRPTPAAYRNAWELISTVGVRMQQAFPYGYVMEDGEGGIRIEWESSSRHVRLAIPARQEGKLYIYHQHGDKHGVEDVSDIALTGWLYWLSGE
jgi:hypothetical protein